MSRPKLVIAINSTWNFVNFRSGLIRALVVDGWEIVAVAPDDGHAAAVEKLGCRFVPIAMDRRRTSILGEIALLWRFYRLLRAERPAALLTFTIKPNIYGSLAAHRLGIATVANVAGLGTAFLNSGPLNRVVRRLYRAALSRNPMTFFQNAEDRDLFVRHDIVSSGRTRLLPGSGIDLQRFSPPPRRVQDGDPPRTVFLMIARLLWAKGLAEYRDAASAVRHSQPDAVFRLIGRTETGRGGVPTEVVRQWSEEGDIEFLGQSDDVRSEIAKADCVVLPTFYPEGTPRVLLEAAAMGRPLISTDVPGCRSVIEDGQNGYLVPPRDAEALRAAIERFTCLDQGARIAMGAASRALAEERFDEKLVIAHYRKVLGEVVNTEQSLRP